MSIDEGEPPIEALLKMYKMYMPYRGEDEAEDYRLAGDLRELCGESKPSQSDLDSQALRDEVEDYRKRWLDSQAKNAELLKGPWKTRALTLARQLHMAARIVQWHEARERQAVGLEVRVEALLRGLTDTDSMPVRDLLWALEARQLSDPRPDFVHFNPERVMAEMREVGVMAEMRPVGVRAEWLQ